jgi:hypothetical protein
MNFSEKSAWGLLIGLGIMSWWYFPRAFAVVEASDNPVALGAISVVCVVGLVIFEAVYHAVIAARGGDLEDERDRFFDLKAERNAGFVLGIALFILVGRILATTSVPELGAMTPLLIAVWILFAITVSEISKVLWQIWYYRTSS